MSLVPRQIERFSRKRRCRSSSFGGWRKLAVRGGCSLLLWLALFGSAAGWAGEAFERKFDFDVPRQEVGAALTEFAEQADLTLAFPDELVRGRYANALAGTYALQDAIDTLLAGTGLSGRFSDSIVLSISADPPPATEGSGMTLTQQQKPGLLAVLAGVLVGGLASAGDRALAAEAAEATPAILEEVIVTATYRESTIMDTPQSINAVTDDLIQDLGAQSMEDIYTMVPGLSMSGARDGDNRFTIRGVTSQAGEYTYAPTAATVGVYIDATPVTAALGPDNQISGTLFDIERVEILKGPQGTLFGEGSQGGTIRYLYKEPDPTGLGAAVNAAVATMAQSDDYSNRLDGMVNIPLGTRTALRVTGWRSETAGFIDNQNPVEPDYNTGKRTGVRTALKYEADRYSLTASIYHNKTESEGGTATVRPYVSTSFRIPGLEPQSADEIEIYALSFDWDLDWAVFQSMTSYTDRSITAIYEEPRDNRDNLDFFFGGATLAQDHPGCAVNPLCPFWPGLFNLALPGLTIPDGRNLIGVDGVTDHYSERWTQEFRLVSPGDQRLRWTVGLFWKDSEDHTQNQGVAGYFPGRAETFGALFGPLLNDPANTHTDFLEEYAAFGEISYDITGRIELTFGARVSSLEQYFSNTNSDTDDTPVSPKVVLSWRPNDDVLTYFSFATGFRQGNVNNHMEFNYRQFFALIQAREAAGANADDLRELQRRAASHRFFDGDELASYEVGVKAALFGGRARLMAAAYYFDWDDMIVVDEDPLIGGLNFYNVNSGGAEIYGFEFEVAAYLTDRLSVRFAGDVNDAEVTQPPEFGDDSPEGNALIYAPERTVSIAVDYEFPIWSGWSVHLHADHAWVDEQFTNTQNTLSIPDYRKTNARITARDSADRWQVALYSTNLTNEKIMRDRFLASTFYWHPPRQIGLGIGYRM